jgi:cytochrome c oxidase subunit II
MWKNTPFVPENASTFATQVDLLYWFLVALTVFFVVAIGAVVVGLCTWYRKCEGRKATQIEGSLVLELMWSGLPLVIVIGLFAWGTTLFVAMQKVPQDCVDMTVVGKQWMWKVQHPSGVRENSDLHIPVGQAIRLTMTSEDVIHSYSIPAFRTKQDVVPGRYTQMWFEPTKVGQYHIFCMEYCGTGHSAMVGTVTVMERVDYERWLSGSTGEAPEVAGKNLFESMRCSSCHPIDPATKDIGGAPPRGPLLAGIYGKEVDLKGGGKVVVSDEYIRESILKPQAKIVANYEPVMPTYEGQLGEEQILQLAAFIKSLKATP